MQSTAFMDLQIVATIIQASYRDNYDEGEVDNTYEEFIIGKKRFKTAKEAIDWFKREYGKVPDAKLCYEPSYNGDVPAFIAPAEMQVQSPNGFMDATNSMIEDWKKGVIDLYSMEYRMVLAVERPYTVDDFKKEEDIPADWFEN